MKLVLFVCIFCFFLFKFCQLQNIVWFCEPKILCFFPTEILIPCHFTTLTVSVLFFLVWASFALLCPVRFYSVQFELTNQRKIEWRSSDAKSQLFDTHFSMEFCIFHTFTYSGFDCSLEFFHSFWPNSHFLVASFFPFEHKL